MPPPRAYNGSALASINQAVFPAYKLTKTMGQQHRKETKRRRRTAYIKRQKEISKNSKGTAPVQLARKPAAKAEA